MRYRGLMEFLLLPASWLYGGVTCLRNLLFDCGLKKQESFPIPVISVGNITVGGTGKTPHTELLVEMLRGRMGLAVLSRGYGRRTRGYILAGTDADAWQIGDEPMQIHVKYPDIAVAVCEDRCEGVRRLMSDVAPQAVILDDAFQHRHIRPSLNILLVDWNRNIMNDRMLPSGRLRESVSGRKRADLVIVTKCPAGLTGSQMDSFRKTLCLREGQDLFFSKLEYGTPYSFADRSPFNIKEGDDVLLVTGIARPDALRKELERAGAKVRMMEFGDHHDYTVNDIDSIGKCLNDMPEGAYAVTTEKDQSKLIKLNRDKTFGFRMVVMPVRARIENDEALFLNLIESHVTNLENNKISD